MKSIFFCKSVCFCDFLPPKLTLGASFWSSMNLILDSKIGSKIVPQIFGPSSGPDQVLFLLFCNPSGCTHSICHTYFQWKHLVVGTTGNNFLVFALKFLARTRLWPEINSYKGQEISEGSFLVFNSSRKINEKNYCSSL